MQKTPAPQPAIKSGSAHRPHATHRPTPAQQHTVADGLLTPGVSAHSNARSAHPAHLNLLHLQRALGNRAVGHLIQTKLTISRPHDPDEREADQVANTVMRMTEPDAPGTEATRMPAQPLPSRMTPRMPHAAAPPLADDKDEAVASTLVLQRVPVAVREEDDEAQVAPKLEPHLSPQIDAQHKTVQTQGAHDLPIHRQAMEGEEMAEEAQHATPPLQRPRADEEAVQTQRWHAQRTPLPGMRSLSDHFTGHAIQRLCTACAGETQQDEGQLQQMVHRQAALPPVPDDEDMQEPPVQRKGPQTPSPRVTPSLAANIHALNGSGSRLPDATRAFFEPRFGADLSQVRVHTDSRAAETANSIQARAFTVGRNIAFGAGQYAPESREGRQLLAHELTHVVQQNGSQVQRAQPLATGQAPQVATSVEPEAETKGGSEGPDTGFSTSVVQSVKLANRGLGQGEGLSQRIDGRGNSRKGRLNFLSTKPTQQDPNKPVFDAYKGQSVNKIGHVSAPANQYEVAKTNGVNVRAKPDGALPHIAKVVFDTEVQVRALDNTGAFYFVIAKTGAVGWINKDFVALDPPDTGSRLHHITESNLTTILKNEYIDKKLWTLGTGNDYTTLAAAVVVANAGRKGVFVDWDVAKKYKEDNTLKRWFDPWMIDNFAIYHGSTILAGHNIWLPSANYVRMLQSSGVIGSRPGWVNAAVDVGKGIAGFVAGVVSGVFGSIWDTLTGLWDLAKGIVGTIRSVLDGSLFASIEAIYDTITNMTWEDLKRLVDEIITMGQNAFNDFQKQWEHPDTYQQWHFKGYIIGAVALEVVLAIFTGGATLGAKVLAKIGKYLPKLMRVFNKLLDLADKLPGRRGKGGADRPGKGRDGDHDRDKDNKEMSTADRTWEQARVMAALFTEEHDLMNTPVATLIPLLNTTIATRYKGVSGYKAIPLGLPGAYKIIQLTRRKDVDDRYTEGKAEEAETSQGLRKTYNSLKEAPEYPKDFRSVQNGTQKYNVKNKQLLEELRKIESGEWKKIYSDGYSNGEKISIHYFQSRSGKVFDVKVKRGWSNLE